MGFSVEEIEGRTVRYGDLIPCTTAFIDAKTPGSDQKENFCIIGPGVAENPGQYVHVKIPHGFNIGGARQPKGCINSQHSHVSEEVFLVHSGSWAFRWGHDGTDGEVVLKQGDVISIPINVFRGFECVSDEESFLFAILGNDDPGHVTWAPHVFEQAKGHGLVLTEAGHLIDTSNGEEIPDGDKPCIPTSLEDVKAFRQMSAEEMGACVVTNTETNLSSDTELCVHSNGVVEAPIIGPPNPAEMIDAGKIGNPHGFHFRKVVLANGGVIPGHSRSEEEVVFVHQGSVSLVWDSESIQLNAGDTTTIPKGMNKSLRTSSDAGATLYIVRGGDVPAAPSWK